MFQPLTRRVQLTHFNSKITLTQDAALINQREPFAVEAILGVNKSASQKNLFTAQTQHTAVHLVLRTPIVYSDADIIAVVVWTDGPGFGRSVGQSVSLVFSANNGENHTLACGVVSSSAKDCTRSLNKPDWFGTDTDVEVSVHAVLVGTEVKSTLQRVRLLKKRPPAVLNSAGIYIALPSYPVVSTGSFDVHVFASTNAVNIPPRKEFALQVLTFEITHSTAFKFNSIVSPSGLYDLTENHEDETKVRVVAVQGSGVSVSTVTGSNLLVAVLRMTASPSTTSTDSRVPFRVTLVDMVSSASLKVLANVPGAVYHAGGMSVSLGDGAEKPHGFVEITQASNVGLLARAASGAEQELVNLASLGVASLTSQITVYLVKSCHISASKQCHEPATRSITRDFVCETTNANVLNRVGKKDCSVSFSGSEKHGGDTAVSVTYEDGVSDLTTQVPFRVWFPEKFDLSAADPILNKVVTQSGSIVRNGADCNSDLFQSTSITASAVLTRVTNAGSISSPRLDLTSMFSYVVTEGVKAAVSIADNIVHGIEPAVGVKIGCQRGCRDKTVELSVTRESTAIKHLSASILNSVAVTHNFDGGRRFTDTDSFAVTAVASNSLTREGDSAQVFVNMKTADNAFVPVPASQLNVTSSVLTVTQNTLLMVPMGAVKAEGCHLVHVLWSSCGTEVSSVRPFVSLELPAVVSVDLTANPNTIYSRFDPLAHAPTFAATSTTLIVKVSFDDGRQRDFSRDPRATFTVDKQHLAEVYKTEDLRRHLRVPGNSLVQGKVVVTTELGSYAPGLSGRTTVIVDRFSSLQLSSRSFPRCADKGCFNKVVISRLPDGVEPTRGAFQRVSLSLAAYSVYGTQFKVGLGSWSVCKISDRTKLNLPNDLRVCPSDAGGACTVTNGELGNDAPLAGVSAGRASISATWREQTTALDFTVTDTIVRVTKLEQSQRPRSTISGVINSEHKVGVKASFSDVTSFYQKEVSSWVPASTYLIFKSFDLPSLKTSADGTMTLVGNSPGPGTIDMRVSAKANTDVHSTVPIYTNLYPGAWDVDVEVGQGEEAQFQYTPGAKTLAVSVRINTGSSVVLTNFQFSLSFDSSVLQIQQGDALPGKDWPYSFEATTGDPIDEVQVSSTRHFPR